LKTDGFHELLVLDPKRHRRSADRVCLRQHQGCAYFMYKFVESNGLLHNLNFVYAQVQIQFVPSIPANKTSLCLHTDQNVVDLSVYSIFSSKFIPKCKILIA